MNTTDIITADLITTDIVTTGITTAGAVTESAAPPTTSRAASARAAGSTTATGAPAASPGASPATPRPAGSAAARPGGTAPAARAVTDRAAARTVAGARPPGRRDQRGPGGGVRPRRRPYTAPHELFAERLLAVLSGSRPVHWMLGQTVGEAYEQLVLLAPATPLRGRSARPVIRRCRGFQPRPGVIEAFASVAAGEQVRALAFRLEQGTDLRWRCAAVETGGARGAATA